MAVDSSSTQQSLRKAIDALKDSTKVGLTKAKSNDYKEVDVAVLKATNHVERLPKEKHIRTILHAVSPKRHFTDVFHCVNALSKRLFKTRSWVVALKTLIVIHRALREVGPNNHPLGEVGPNFREALGEGYVVNLSHFHDDSSPEARDYSAWIRTYSLYLEERLKCYLILERDVEKDRSILSYMHTGHLHDELPVLQLLIFHLLDCQPEGLATYNILIQYALSMISGDSVRLYVASSDRVLTLVDKYFEMPRHKAVRTLEIYRMAENQAERLSNFFEVCRGFDFGRGQKFIKIEQPPASFIQTMEEYVKEAPRDLTWIEVRDDSVSGMEYENKYDHFKKIKIKKKDDEDDDVDEKSDPPATSPESPKNEQSETAVTYQVADLLSLDELNQEASELDEKNALALAILTPDVANDIKLTGETTSWELALLTEQTSNEAAVAESKSAGGLDKLTLNSLYDDAITIKANQNGNYHFGPAASNPFEDVPFSQDPFYASSDKAPPTNVRMTSMTQQQTLTMQDQQQQQQLTDQHINDCFI